MGYFITSDPENAVPEKSVASPKTHTPGSRVEERGHRFYSPTLGRWVSRDPIGEEVAANLSAYLGNSPLNDVDVLGLWLLIFKGTWSASEQSAVNAAFTSLKANMPSYLARLNQWMAAAGTLPDSCVYKKRLQQELTVLSAILRGMQSGLNSSSPLKLRKSDLGTDTDAAGGFPWSGFPTYLGNTFNGNIYLNTNASDPFTGWGASKMVSTIFHELSHVAGVPKDDDSSGWWTDNAHRVEALAGNPSAYTLVPLVSYIEFDVGLGDKCCPKLSDWIPSP